MKLNYYTTTTIHLSLEDFHNAGLSPEKTKMVIESIINPLLHCGYSSGDKLRCSSSGLNSNWNVNVMVNHPEKIKFIVDEIYFALKMQLNINKVKNKEEL